MCTEESEPTFSTEPSSRETLARALACVLTTSCQTTTVLVKALMDLEPRAMLTAGITREISPARWSAGAGVAPRSPGTAIAYDIRHAKATRNGDFVFI